jgi:predicted ATPase
MRFEIKNLGIIKEADIEFKGLTILAGHNNIGKSFISRIVYSIIRSINQYEEQFIIEKSDRLDRIFRHISSRLRHTSYSVNNENIKSIKLIDDILTSMRNFSHRYFDTNSMFEKYNFDNLISDFLIHLKDLKDSVDTEQIYKEIDELRVIISEEANDENKLRFTLNRYISNEFKNQITNGNEILDIKCNDKNLDIFNIKIENDKIKMFKTLNPLQFVDSTLIETPIILHLSRFLKSFAMGQLARIPSRRDFTRNSDLAIHIPDLIDKLSKLRVIDEKVIDYDIFKVINGKFEFDPKEDDFYYVNKNGKRIKPINMASGVKAFGILEILINNGSINSNSLLIIDEPEVHLHPEWQIKYAEVICALVKNNIPVIISSHSPYLIKGIETFKKRYNIIDKIKYYLGEEKEGFTYFKDVTENIDPIYEKLSIPFMKLDLNR